MRYLLIFIFALMTGASAFAFSISQQRNYVVRWANPKVPIEVGDPGCKDIADGSDLAAIRAAMKEWTDIDCSNLELNDVGTTSSTSNVITDNSTDGRNVLVWINDNQWEFGQYVLGVTAPVYDGYGRIYEADTIFNGYLQRWTTLGSRGQNMGRRIDVNSVALHELGHFFGLQHVLNSTNTSDPETMQPAVDQFFRTRILTPDDQAGACFLYPQGGPHKCTNIDDCPMVVNQNNQGEEYYTGQLACGSDGTCAGLQALPQGTIAIGEKCTSDLECKNGLFCQSTSVQKFCTQSCDPNNASSCPATFSCLGYQNSSGGACVPSTWLSNHPSPNPSPPPSPPTTPSTPTAPTTPTTGGGKTAPVDNNPTCACDVTWKCDGNCKCDLECRKRGCDSSPISPTEHLPELAILGICFVLRRRLKIAFV
jgi:hypothetical protein